MTIRTIVVKEKQREDSVIDMFGESYQEFNVQFAFLNAKDEQVHPEIKCRDLMTCVVASTYLKETIFINNWLRFNPKTSPYENKFTKLSLHFRNKTLKSNFIRRIKELNELEIKWNVSPTVIYEVTNPLSLIIEGDKCWQTACWKISLYTFLLRIKCCKSQTLLSNTDGDDRYYYKILSPNLDFLMYNINNDMWDGYNTVSYCNGSTGWKTLIEGYNNKAQEVLESFKKLPKKETQCAA